MENKNCQLVCNLLYINANNFQSKKKKSFEFCNNFHTTQDSSGLKNSVNGIWVNKKKITIYLVGFHARKVSCFKNCMNNISIYYLFHLHE